MEWKQGGSDRIKRLAHTHTHTHTHTQVFLIQRKSSIMVENGVKETHTQSWADVAGC